MNYKKLIGYSIDTNQVKSDGLIKDENEAKNYIDQIISIYGEGMLENMFLFGHRFTSYTYSFPIYDKITLKQYLNN